MPIIKLTPDKLEEFLALTEAGLTQAECAEELGVSEQALRDAKNRDPILRGRWNLRKSNLTKSALKELEDRIEKGEIKTGDLIKVLKLDKEFTPAKEVEHKGEVKHNHAIEQIGTGLLEPESQRKQAEFTDITNEEED